MSHPPRQQSFDLILEALAPWYPALVQAFPYQLQPCRIQLITEEPTIGLVTLLVGVPEGTMICEATLV